jgi:ATP-dependent helicase HrpB
MDPLPIDPLLPQVISLLRAENRLVVEAAPGAGKTTRLPLALLRAGFADDGEIVVLQPRRIAARLAAHHVSGLLDEAVGETCGYQVRFEERASARTRLRFMTEALLTRRLRDDPLLEGISCVILDEFHERHVAADLNLALLRRLQQRRAEARPLRLVVMSATLDGGMLAEQLGCRRLVSEGRAFPVAMEWMPAPVIRRSMRERPLRDEMSAAVVRALRFWTDAGKDDGHVLLFLPGVAEIRRAADACAGIARAASLEICTLYGAQSIEEQHRALSPRSRSLILATNVAETSVTIDGVSCVIDTGVERRAGFDPWSGLPKLEVENISRASAIQRAGRAGRTAPGTCIRLYSQADYLARPEFDPPEIVRLELSDALLDLYAAGVRNSAELEWIEPPPPVALAKAEELLTDLGAIAGDPAGGWCLTEMGRAMLRFPVHPRQARFLVEAGRRGVGALGTGVAALLSERSIRRRGERAAFACEADVLADLADLEQVLAEPERAGMLGLDIAACRQVARVRAQLIGRKQGRRGKQGTGGGAGSVKPNGSPQPATETEREEALLHSLLCAYPDRVARVRDEAGGGRNLIVCGGTTAQLGAESALGPARWALALALQEHRSGARPGRVVVRSAARIEPDWLIDHFSDRIEERCVVSWDAQRERVEGKSELVYRGLAIESSPIAPGSAEGSAALRRAALEAGPEQFVPKGVSLPAWLARAAICAEHLPDFRAVDDESVRGCLSLLCEGRSSFAELRDAGLLAMLQLEIGGEHVAKMPAFVPEFVTLPGRRRVPVNYEAGKPPWIESRLQDFFGLQRGPCVADGRLALVLHLLAPNRRAVQVTTDLPGFWERHYPALRKTLMRRYPRHAWPEKP